MKRDPETTGIPIIMLTAKGEAIDRIVGLELGADDYITKPFSPREVLLRVRAVLRRTPNLPRNSPANQIQIDNLKIDIDKHQVFSNGDVIDLTATEFQNPFFICSFSGACIHAQYPDGCGLGTRILRD